MKVDASTDSWTNRERLSAYGGVYPTRDNASQGVGAGMQDHLMSDEKKTRYDDIKEMYESALPYRELYNLLSDVVDRFLHEYMQWKGPVTYTQVPRAERLGENCWVDTERVATCAMELHLGSGDDALRVPVTIAAKPGPTGDWALSVANLSNTYVPAKPTPESLAKIYESLERDIREFVRRHARRPSG